MRSTDFGLDGRGNLIMLFLAKQDNRYFPLTPQGIVGLQSNRYTKGVLDPPTGLTVLKEYSIKDSSLSLEEKEHLEEIIKSKTVFDPNKVPPKEKNEEPSGQGNNDQYRAFFVISIVLIFCGALVVVARRNSSNRGV